MKESVESLEQSNKEFIKENENLKKSVKVNKYYLMILQTNIVIGEEWIYLTEAAKTQENVK